jgi:hypothetical protein
LGTVGFIAALALVGYAYVVPKGTDATITAAFFFAVFSGVLWFAWYTLPRQPVTKE